jgi:hypothetical protein
LIQQEKNTDTLNCIIDWDTNEYCAEKSKAETKQLEQSGTANSNKMEIKKV